MSKVCLDYGHGGSDPGAVYKGRKESEDNLSIGREIAKELKRHGVTVGETRITNATVSLRERSNYANEGNYNYFISLHRNAFRPEVATGAETFIYINASKKARELAKRIQQALVNVGFVDRGVKIENFHVLRETKDPAVLVEMGFLDNSKDNLLFDNKREEIIEEISKAILYQLGIPYIKNNSDDELKKAIEILAQEKLINSPDYWSKNAKEGKQIKGEYAATLIKRMAVVVERLKKE